MIESAVNRTGASAQAADNGDIFSADRLIILNLSAAARQEDELPSELRDMQSRRVQLDEVIKNLQDMAAARAKWGADSKKNLAQLPQANLDSRILPNKAECCADFGENSSRIFATTVSSDASRQILRGQKNTKNSKGFN